jgi:hypothetical protein
MSRKETFPDVQRYRSSLLPVSSPTKPTMSLRTHPRLPAAPSARLKALHKARPSPPLTGQPKSR